MSRTELKVCPDCGWYAHSYGEVCDPKLGAVADRLRALFPNVTATKLGYGFGMLTFKFSEDRNLRLQVNNNGTFIVRDLFWLETQSMDDAAEMIQALSKLGADGC